MGSLRAKGWRSNTRSRGAWRLGKASIWDLRSWREPAVLAALYTLRLLRSWKLAKVLEGAAEAEQLVLALAGCKPGGKVSRLAVAKLWGGENLGALLGLDRGPEDAGGELGDLGHVGGDTGGHGVGRSSGEMQGLKAVGLFRVRQWGPAGRGRWAAGPGEEERPSLLEGEHGGREGLDKVGGELGDLGHAGGDTGGLGQVETPEGEAVGTGWRWPAVGCVEVPLGCRGRGGAGWSWPAVVKAVGGYCWEKGT